MTDEHRRAAMAERAARAGGVVARELFRAAPDVETKESKTDLVTEADVDAQRQVVATIRKEFPDDAVVGEEEDDPGAAALGIDRGETAEEGGAADLATEVPERGAAWVVDPIDGTANFVRGLRLWTTSVAAVVDGDPVGAATYLPAQQDVYTVGPDSVTRNGEALSVSDRTDPETFAAAVLGRWGPETSEGFGAVASAVAADLGDLRRLGSMQATLAHVAAGGLDAAFMPTQPNVWDSLAGACMVRRAGGTVTDLDGDPWGLDSDSLVASNGEAHEAVLDAARAAAD